MHQEQLFLEYARKRSRRVIALVSALGLVGLMLLFAERLPERSVGRLALLIFGGLGAYTWIDWRCPACKGHLGREFSHRHCSHCGTRLQA